MQLLCQPRTNVSGMIRSNQIYYLFEIFFLEGLFVCICKSQADQMHVFAFLFS